MKQTTFFVLVGALSAVSLTSGILGLFFAKAAEGKGKQKTASSFRDVYDDNAPDEELPDDFT